MQATFKTETVPLQVEPLVAAELKPTSSPRLEYHHASGHLRERGPGYYLILLRNELRHRSLRRKSLSNYEP